MHSKSKFPTPNVTQDLPIIQPQDGNNLELEHIIGYSGKSIKTISFINNSPNLFVYCIGGSIVIEDINDRHKQSFLRGHDMSVTALAVSSSGKLLISGQQGTIHSKIPESPVILWDLNTLKPKYIFRGLRHGITNLSFSPDERFIAATAANNVLMIWDCLDFSVVHNKVLEVPFSLITWKLTKRNNSKYSSYSLVTSVGTNIVISSIDFDVASMQYHMKSMNFQLPSSGLIRNYTVSFIDASGDFLYAGTTGGEICIFNITNQVFKAAIPISQNGVLSFEYTKDWIFVGSGDGKLKRLKGKETRWVQEAEIQLEGKIISLSLSPDGKELLAGTSVGNIYRIITSTLDATLHTEGHIDCVNDIVFPQDRNDMFATIDNQGCLIVWDSNEINVITRCLPIYNKKIKGGSVSFTDDGKIAGGWEDGFVRAFDITKAKFSPLKWEVANAHRGCVTSLYIDPNYILTGGEDGIVRVWSRKHRSLLFQISAHKKTVSRVFPDLQKSHLIHSCSQDKTVNSFCLKTEKKLMLHQAKNGVICDMTQRKDNEFELVTCGINTPILFWDCDMNDPVEKIDVSQKLLTIDISKSGSFMAVGTENGEVMIYDIVNKGYLGKYLGHSDSVNKLKWSADEKQIVSVSSDGSICIWNFFP